MQNSPQLIADLIKDLRSSRYSALDLLAENSAEENLVSLLLGARAQAVAPGLLGKFSRYREYMERTDASGVKVVVFGGGTGLATLIGGDSRRDDWAQRPFTGLKQIFADLHSVVCVTDDGGSTGELRKILPLVGLGDLRHVLLAAIRRDALIRTYALSETGAQQLALTLHSLFNYRFSEPPSSLEALLAVSKIRLQSLPGLLRDLCTGLLDALFSDGRLRPLLHHPQCLGNLLLASAIYKYLDPDHNTEELLRRPQMLHLATAAGLAEIVRALGMPDDAVLPAVLTPAELCMLYSNGVLATSEDKSSTARRQYPIDRVMTAFCGEAVLHPRLLSLIAEADILLFAPGSLYTSIIPILQTPAVAEAIRANQGAMKLLVANIWVQTGETDATREAPERKFYVSDMICAYHRNIPGGVEGLFSHVIALNMADIPSSVLQGYALEAKEPIFIDRERVQQLGFGLIEAAVFSWDLLRRQNRIQHDPDALAKTIKALWILRSSEQLGIPCPEQPLPALAGGVEQRCNARPVPCSRYQAIQEQLHSLETGRIIIWAASYERTGDFSLFDRLLSDDDYLSLLVTDFFTPPSGPLIECGPDEWLQQLTIGPSPEEATALLQRLEQSMSDVEGLSLQMPSCPTRSQRAVVPQLGCVRHGSILIDPHGEKRWVYSAAVRSTGEVEIMTFRRQGRSNVVLSAAGKWQLVSA